MLWDTSVANGIICFRKVETETHTHIKHLLVDVSKAIQYLSEESP